MLIKKIGLRESFNAPEDIKVEAEKILAEAWNSLEVDYTNPDTFVCTLDADGVGTPNLFFEGADLAEKAVHYCAKKLLAPVAGTPIVDQYAHFTETRGYMPKVDAIVDSIKYIIYHRPSIMIELADTRKEFEICIDNLKYVQWDKMQKEKCLVLLEVVQLLAPINSERSKYLAAKSRAYDIAKKKKIHDEKMEQARLDRMAKVREDFISSIKNPDAVISSTGINFYEALGYLAATVQWVRAYIPSKYDYLVGDFDKLFPGEPYIVKITTKGPSGWENGYGKSFSLKIPAEAARTAPLYLTKDLAGTSHALFSKDTDETAGALHENGIISNMGFVGRLVMDYGFHFVDNEHYGVAPTLDELLTKVPEEMQEVVKTAYALGEETIEAAGGRKLAPPKRTKKAKEAPEAIKIAGVSDIDTGKLELDDVNPFETDFADPDDTGIIGPEDFDESFDEENLPDDPFLIDYENELFSAEDNIKAQAEVDALRAEEDELDEGISDNATLGDVVRIAKEYRKAFKK